MDDSSTAALVEPDQDDARYLKAIASCGDRRSLVVAQPIYSSNGIKLLDTGARIDSRILDRLFGHKLAEPIDACVASEDAVRHRDLVARAGELVAAAPSLAQFEASLGAQSKRIWSALGACPLPPAIAIRLTVARDTAPALYEHSLRAAFLALFIGTLARFSDQDLQVLATAALLHDIGMMHADPSLYAEEKPLAVAARRNLFAHPLTAEVIAQRERLLSPVIAAAVAQHHERVDGTGYPRGLQGEAIGKFGRVLMLVEVALAILEHEQGAPYFQLSLILRLNHRSFDANLSRLVLGALPLVTQGEGEMSGECSVCQQVAALISAWPDLCRAMPPPASDPASTHINARIERLRRWLAEAGFSDPEAAALAADGEPKIRVELVALSREALWHIRQIAYDALHRWPGLQAPEGASAAAQWVASSLSAGRTTGLSPKAGALPPCAGLQVPGGTNK